MKRRYPPKAPNRERPTPQALRDRLVRAGITLNPRQLDQLWRYHNLLRQRNHDRELTRLIGFDTIVTKHYIDSMIVGDLHRLPSPLVDIGTGAGFPGIPLKIRYPHLKLVLAEPRPKRVAFLKEACQTLALSGWDVFDHKVVSRSFQKPMAGAITRAVETIDKTWLRTSACLGVGGQLIFLKGPNVDPELKDMEARFGGQFEVTLNKPYRLPHTPHERRLVVLTRKIPAVIPSGEAPREAEEDD